ncbi:hypothetical protein OCU04_005568 [Sclerotinia nivalis]|uniref:Uncharacterized protein n=1 Tax=Sclerotinia nivalis TaxID=352851 RepID=A0A9X0DLB8_9HELO|nr:hypothetical protein OCU04_005568 [Sclerotinia nivalis]
MVNSEIQLCVYFSIMIHGLTSFMCFHGRFGSEFFITREIIISLLRHTGLIFVLYFVPLGNLQRFKTPILIPSHPILSLSSSIFMYSILSYPILQVEGIHPVLKSN